MLNLLTNKWEYRISNKEQGFEKCDETSHRATKLKQKRN